MQPPTLLCLPTPWPLGSRVTGASSLWAVSLTPRSQPIANLLQMDGLKLGRGESLASMGRVLFFPVLLEALEDSVAFYSFEGTFWETIFLAEAYLLFVFHFWFFLVDCGALTFFCILCLDFLWVSLSISHFFCFHLAMPYEIMGGCWYIAVDTLRYSRLTLLLYPSLSCS
jgi:hypothetical protein